MPEFNPLEQKNIKPINQKWWDSYGTPENYESIQAFLYRVKNNFKYKASSFGDIGTEEFYSELLKKVPKILKSKRERMPTAELLKNLRILEDSIERFAARPSSFTGSQDKIEYFSYKNNNRNLLHGRNAFLIDTLGLKEIGLPDKITNEIIKDAVDNKNIIILGGGDSVMDLLTDKDLDLTPKSVTNIDPYIISEYKDKNLKNIYKSISLHAESPNLISELNNQNIPKADEIWASWAVPTYSERVEDITALFKNIDAIIAVGGIVRIYPLEIANLEKDEMFDADDFEKRKDAWVQATKDLVDTGRYNLDIIEGKVMHLQKLK